ncbi:hypothetical protein ACPV3A_37310 [Paenibacillus sp. Dod16]|uniref:hypothetical protein n=1 Tax=Paenibacillus sp. Dod16 TaxID=3416392 RepID=UPI003CEE52E3
MVWNKLTNVLDRSNEDSSGKNEIALTMDALRQILVNMSDAEVIERPALDERTITLIYMSILH